MQALYFDGRNARGQPVRLTLEEGFLVARSDDVMRSWPLAEVQWPERTRHGQRLLLLRRGGTLQVADAGAFDAWRRELGHAESWVVRVQQNWRATLAAVLALVLVAAAAYRWGVPWAADALLVLVPASVDQTVGTAALENIEARWLGPSRLPPARQAQLHTAFAAAVQASFPAGQQPPWALRFRAADKALGANAFALPGGTIIITDALVELLQGQDDALVGVLAHELGHVRRRHGMRALAQFALLGTATAVAIGDFSSVLASVPALLAQVGYSRDAEREADAEAARVLLASGRSPAVMAVFFERMATLPRSGPPLPFALSTHPLDDERVRFFREASR